MKESFGGVLHTASGQIKVSKEVGDYIEKLNKESQLLRAENNMLKLENFDLRFNKKRKFLWLEF
jgi:hypothetical protein